MRKFTLALKFWTVSWNKENEFIIIQHQYFPLSVGTVDRCKEEPAIPDKCIALGAWAAKHPPWHQNKEVEQWTLPKDSEIHYPNIVYGLQSLVQIQVWKSIPDCNGSLNANFDKGSLAESPSRTTKSICCYSFCQGFSKISYFACCPLCHWGGISYFLLQHSLCIIYFLYHMLNV